jgi:hypothetical protein
MSSTAISRDTCHYLFGEEVGLFSDVSEESVNPLLETMIKIIEFLAGKPEAFFLFDPMSFNHQCHIYSLIAVKAFSDKEGKIDRRFLIHFFFLSFAFINDVKLLVGVVQKAAEELGLEMPEKFIKDASGKRVHASRLALNRLFREYMKKESAHLDELSLIASQEEALFLPGPKYPLYTFPKFAGIIYFIDAIARENIPLIFKVQVITKEGRGSFLHTNSDLGASDPRRAVIVFDMIACGEELSVTRCEAEARKCNSFAQRNISQKSRHRLFESCFFCTEKKVDIEAYKAKFEPVFLDEKRMLHAVAADFTKLLQTSFVPLIEGCEKLGPLFRRALSDVDTLDLSAERALNMSVVHVYPEMLSYALTKSLVMCRNYGEHLSERGLV